MTFGCMQNIGTINLSGSITSNTCSTSRPIAGCFADNREASYANVAYNKYDLTARRADFDKPVN